MKDRYIRDQSIWQEIAVSLLPALASNPDGITLIVSKFIGKYLPALLKAGSEKTRERVWLAFWSYLISQPTRRKPITLSQQNADLLIYEFKHVLQEKTTPCL